MNQKPLTRQDVVDKYLYKDEVRFCKRFYRADKFELIFSKTLYRYDKECPGIRKKILKLFENELPGTIVRIINIHRVMVKYYNFYIDMEDIELCRRIEYVMSDTLDTFIRDKRRKLNTFSNKHHKPRDARRELKERGFVRESKFKDRKKGQSYAHIVTNNNMVGSKLVYPVNYTIGVIKGEKWWEIPNAYIVHNLIGIRNFTSVLTSFRN